MRFYAEFSNMKVKLEVVQKYQRKATPDAEKNKLKAYTEKGEPFK